MAGRPCTIPQHPAVRLLNFELVSGFYGGNVILSVIALERNAHPQRISAGNEFVHDGHAYSDALGDMSANGVELEPAACVRIGDCCTAIVAIHNAAVNANIGGIFEALAAQDQVPTAGDFGVFFHLRRKPVHRLFQLAVIAGKLTRGHGQAVHAGLDLQHFAGQVLVALAVHRAGTFPAGAAHALKAGFAGGDCGAHQVGVELPPACVLNVHDLPAGKAGTTGHGHFARGIGHAFQYVVQVWATVFRLASVPVVSSRLPCTA